ncbi:unnamed protein product [marine sediment metagenome]|uniref:Uncharacterized protein n=1 Tax=marine sediment metagenome TaxID=412755 RepID=X1D5X6_9ZZZZ
MNTGNSSYGTELGRPFLLNAEPTYIIVIKNMGKLDEIRKIFSCFLASERIIILYIL